MVSLDQRLWYPAVEEDGGTLGDPEDSPAETLEEGRQPVLGRGLAPAGSPGEDQSPGLDPRTLHLTVLRGDT